MIRRSLGEIRFGVKIPLNSPVLNARAQVGVLTQRRRGRFFSLRLYLPNVLFIKDLDGMDLPDIVVQGRLDLSSSGRIAGMKITTEEREGARSRTTLVGMVQDQAELSGVLETLYNLHLPIISLEWIVDES